MDQSYKPTGNVWVQNGQEHVEYYSSELDSMFVDGQRYDPTGFVWVHNGLESVQYIKVVDTPDDPSEAKAQGAFREHFWLTGEDPPTEGVSNGDIGFEIGANQRYCFDAENQVWYNLG